VNFCFFLSFSARGNMTCQNRPGSLGYEVKDAQTYASWGVDYLKMDTCHNTAGIPAVVEYSIMRDALNATGRPIFFSLCGKSNNSDVDSLFDYPFISLKNRWCRCRRSLATKRWKQLANNWGHSRLLGINDVQYLFGKNTRYECNNVNRLLL